MTESVECMQDNKFFIQQTFCFASIILSQNTNYSTKNFFLFPRPQHSLFSEPATIKKELQAYHH